MPKNAACRHVVGYDNPLDVDGTTRLWRCVNCGMTIVPPAKEAA